MATTGVNKDRGFLSLAFAGSMVSIVLAALLSSVSISSCIALLANHVFGFVQPLSWLLGGLNGFTSFLVVSVAAMMFALVGMWLLMMSKKKIAKSPDYIQTNAYRGIFYVTIGVMGVVTVASLSAMVAIAIASLVTIGGNVSVGNMYLDEFLPAAVTALVSGVVMYMLMGIAKNKSGFVSSLSALLVALASAALIMSVVAVGVKSHDNKFNLNISGGDVVKIETDSSTYNADDGERPSLNDYRRSNGTVDYDAYYKAYQRYLQDLYY